MNWMDYESNLSQRLDRLELKSMLIDHILNRLRYLTDLKDKDEYDYTETLGRIKELELLLEFLNKLSQPKN